MRNQIKLETHAHTSEVSGCGKLPAADLVRRCALAGYRALVITDHLIHGWRAEKSRAARVQDYLAGYRAAREAGEALGLAVLLGAEARIRTGSEDFLVYGLREELLPELMAITDEAEDFALYSRAVRAMGLLLVQAHPFRRGLTRAPLALLDGVEVYNGNPRQENSNDLALEYARQGGAHMIHLSGSDAHQVPDVGRGGILVPDSILNSAALVEYLRAHPQPARIEAEP